MAGRIFTQTLGDRYESDACEHFCDEVHLPGGSMSQDFQAVSVRWFMALTQEGMPNFEGEHSPFYAEVVSMLRESRRF